MRRPRKILADEREILREQRIAGFAAAEDQRFSGDGDGDDGDGDGRCFR